MRCYCWACPVFVYGQKFRDTVHLKFKILRMGNWCSCCGDCDRKKKKDKTTAERDEEIRKLLDDESCSCGRCPGIILGGFIPSDGTSSCISLSTYSENQNWGG